MLNNVSERVMEKKQLVEMLAFIECDFVCHRVDFFNVVLA